MAKKELVITEDQIKNFSIDVVKDYEGCPEALIFLKRVYKNKVKDLRETRSDFINLINVGKGVWITNFCMSILKKEHRIEFFDKHLLKEIKKLASKELKQDIKESIVGHRSYKSNIDKLLVKALHEYYKDHNELGTFTRSISKSIKYISEARCSMTIHQKDFIENQYDNCLKTYSLMALDFVGIFKKIKT